MTLHLPEKPDENGDLNLSGTPENRFFGLTENSMSFLQLPEVTVDHTLEQLYPTHSATPSSFLASNSGKPYNPNRKNFGELYHGGLAIDLNDLKDAPEHVRIAAEQLGKNANEARGFVLANTGRDPTHEAWCADFVCSSLKAANIPTTVTGDANYFLHYGKPSEQPKMGDVVVIGDKDGSGKASHVGLLAGHEHGFILVLGGNQGHGHVTISRFPENSVMAIREPPPADQPKPVTVTARLTDGTVKQAAGNSNISLSAAM